MEIKVSQMYERLCIEQGTEWSWVGFAKFNKEIVGWYKKKCLKHGVEVDYNKLEKACIEMIRQGKKIV